MNETKRQDVRRLAEAALVGILASLALVLTRETPEPLALGGSVITSVLLIRFFSRQPVVTPNLVFVFAAGLASVMVVQPALPSGLEPHVLAAMWGLQSALCAFAIVLLRLVNRSAR